MTPVLAARKPYKHVPAPGAPDVSGKLKASLDKEGQKLEQAIPPCRGRTVTASTEATASDHVILCNPASGAIVVDFPLADQAQYMEICIKQVVSNANTVTLSGTFDTVVNPTLGGINRALTVWSDGIAWYVIAKVV